MKNYLYLLLSLLFINNIQIQAQVFTDTQGQLNISNSGTASYTLPIALPPSIQNVGPVINLNYNSGQLGGIAGQGWNISGISSIHRIATRMDIDGFLDGVDFDDNDKLALDGQRLILKTGTYWENGSTYETEIQSNTKIELRKEGQATYFIVNTADGSQMWYGNYNGNNATDQTAYYIVRQEDVNGNYILYDYILSAENALYISEIKFSGNKYVGAGLVNKLEFQYEIAKRTEFSFINGTKITKDLILKRVQVLTNNYIFKRYELTHTTDSQLGYQYVTQVQEFNGALESANPVKFEYNTTAENPGNSEIRTSLPNPLSFADIDFSGDFDGDGKLDFVAYNNLFYGMFKSNSKQLALPSGIRMAINTLENNKLNQKQSFLGLTATSSSQYRFNVYSLDGSTVGLKYFKDVNFSGFNTAYIYHPLDIHPAFYVFGNPQKHYINPDVKEIYKETPILLEGDYNGDGVSDVILSTVFWEQPIKIDGNHFWVLRKEGSDTKRFVLDLNPNTTNSLIEFLDPNNWFRSDYKYQADFNGDGKLDILCINQDKSYRIVDLRFENGICFPNLLASGTLPHFYWEKPLHLGDFNGDGKTDLLIRQDLESTDWVWYQNNFTNSGGDIFIKEQFPINTFVDYGGAFINSILGKSANRSYFVMDTNKDGKSDLVEFMTRVYQPKSWDPKDVDTSWGIRIFTNQIGNTASTQKFAITYQSTSEHHSDNRNRPVPVIGEYKYGQALNDIVVTYPDYKEIYFIDFQKNLHLDAQLKKVSSSADRIIDEIFYKTLEPVGTTGNGSMNNAVYSSTESLTYPYVEIKRMPQSYVVTQHKNTAVGFVKYMDFRYHGLAVNLQGMGAVGYKKTARSAWYQSASAGKIWSITETDPLQRGATTRTYSQYVNPGAIFSFTDSSAPVGMISSVVNTYQSNITPNKVYSLLLTEQNTRDNLTNFFTQQTYHYLPEYNLLEKTVLKKQIFSTVQSTTTTINQYENNPTGTGSDYYIGRLKQSNSSIVAYSDTKKSESKYTYENNRIKKTESKANNTDNVYLTQEYTYDSYGNVLSQTASAPGAQPEVASRTVSYTYDPSGRYIKTTTSPEGLVSTNDTYHPIYGMVTQSTNAYGQINKTTYDNWGKLTKETDYLGKNTIYSYVRNTDKITLYKNHDSGLRKITVTNLLGWVLNEQVRSIDGITYNKVDSKYDYLGRKIEQSEPYTTTASQWNKTEYDQYGRTKQTTAFTGKVTKYSYGPTATGFKVGIDDGIKVTSSVTNANGHTVTSTDPGGAITYTYFADGNLKTSSYSGSTQTITYDEWGRKIKLVDPSAGTYTYKYNAYGETLEEGTPLGATIFTLDDFGKVLKKINGGSNTGIISDYTYDSTTKLLTRIDVVEAGATSFYIYQYDDYKRLKHISETTPYARFNKSITYDGYGRINQEGYSALNLRNNKTQNTKIKNIYKSGHLWKIQDDSTSKALWTTDQVNERGQLVEGTYGNGIKNTNAYDAFGYSQKINFDKDPQSTNPALALTYDFSPITANLKSRTNNAFNTAEVFTYQDNFDRLTTIATTQNGVTTTQTQAYDNTGKITENSQIGSYQYGNTAKKYQVTGITLNPAGADYGNDNMKLSVSYNAFKAPARINLKDKETLFFTYNTFEQRSSMFYGDTQEVREQKVMRKHYSHDGAQEITDNIVTGETTFVTYLSGDGYSSPVVVKGNGAIKEYLYLHRDYQGSIMAISNDLGNIVEQRLYDAWGLVKAVKDGQGNNLTKLTVLDRGYTGHEHLQGVGLIHMNARLYDPVVHRFMGPDNFVQDPSNTQNYNRYGYVFNNPLKYTDPSGEEIVTAIVVGAIISATMYTLDCIANDRPITLNGFMSSAIMGAFSGAVTFGIGNGFNSVCSPVLKATYQALAHGAFQGAMTHLQGGNFMDGFASGSLSSIASSAFKADLNGKDKGLGWANNFRSSDTGMILFGSVSGGLGAELAGGNFWQGAATGLMVSALNHYLHTQLSDPNKQLAKNIAKQYGYNWKEVKAFLDENPFILTPKGVAMGGKEALSSKHIEDGKTIVDYVVNQAQSEIASKIIEYLSPRAGKIWGLGNELLSSQTLHAPNSNYQAERNLRIEACKSALIRYYFQKPVTYQTPSMYNNQQSVQYHSSRFDIMHYRFY